MSGSPAEPAPAPRSRKSAAARIHPVADPDAWRHATLPDPEPAAPVRPADPHRHGWIGLGEPMQAALQLAWESCRAGSFGIGAVITDGDGTVVATGRNRLVETDPGDDVLAGTSLAHAELNAIAKLGFRAHIGRQLTLWTTLQPCLQCLGAIRLSPITDVVVLSPDPLFRGVEQVRHLTPFLDRAWPAIVEREIDEWSVLGLLFPTHIGAFWRSHIDLWALALPRLVGLAEQLVADNELVGLATTVERIEDVAGTLWDRLGTCVGEVAELSGKAPS